MDVDTFRSALIDDVFVTVPSNAAAATISTVEELTPLRLDPVRCGYAVPSPDQSPDFARFVLTEVVRKGYAAHSANGSPVAIQTALAKSRFVR